MQAVFWTAAAIIAYTYFGYPLYIWIRSRVAARPWKQAEIYPTVTIVMAVHNGAPLIQRKIEHLLSLDYPADKYDLIVVSDGSNDGTNEILQGITHPRLRTIICPEHVGKAVALNQGMKAATGEILLFVDIRPYLGANALRQLVTNFADETVGCAAGELSVCDNGNDAGTRAVGRLYWSYEQWIRDCEAQVDSPLGVYGGFYAIRRELAAVYPGGTILDDMYQPLSIIRRGYRSVLDKNAKVVDNWPPTTTGEFNRKVRTLAGNFQLLRLAPWLLTSQNRLRFELISHKLLRLIVPLTLVCLAGSAGWLGLQSRMYAWIFWTQVFFYAIAVAGQKLPGLGRFSGAAYAFCMLNAAVVVGSFSFLVHGRELWKIWGPSAGAIEGTSGLVRRGNDD